MNQPAPNWKSAFGAELKRLARSAALTFPICFVVLLLLHAGMAWISPGGSAPQPALESAPSWPFWPATAAKAAMIAWVFSGSGIDKPFGFVMRLIVLVAVMGVSAVYVLATESRQPWLLAPLGAAVAVALETGLIWRWAVNWKAQAVSKQPEPAPTQAAG